MGISLIVSSVPGVEDRRAPRPRPRPGLFMSDHLASQVEICDRTAGSQIVQHYRLAMARGLGETDVARNHRLEDFARKVTVHLVADLDRATRASGGHRDPHTVGREPRVPALTHAPPGRPR